jgi:hypothetical protein
LETLADIGISNAEPETQRNEQHDQRVLYLSLAALARAESSDEA